MYSANFCIVGMMKNMVNPLPNSFNCCIKQRLDNIEHPGLTPEWIQNIDTADYL